MKYLNEDDFMEEITTFDGTVAPRKNCRFIKGEFYIKNKQCFYVDGMWYRINSNKVLFDHEKKNWVLKESIQLLYGIININAEKDVEYGFFSENKNKNSRIYHNQSVVYLFDKALVTDKNFIREGLNNYYYFINEPKIPKEFTNKLRPRKDGFYSFPFNYGSDELIPEFKRVFDMEFKASELLNENFKYIDNYTFGVEFETDRGAIPEKFLKPNGLIACKDGSISGFEYTTIPFHGYTGIQAIKVIGDLLKKYCSCSPNEALHIHIGGYPRTVKALASLYRLGLILQSEIYSIFPYFYKDTSNFKRKSYCGPLPALAISDTSPNDIFNSVYFWLSNGSNFTRFPTGPHPMDRSGQHKWEVSLRYIWLNMIPIIWGGRGTVEFRCHTPTVNAQKVINWLYITVAILEYAKKHVLKLTSNDFNSLPIITLKDVLKSSYPANIVSVLDKYIDQRKNHYSLKSDCTGEEEILSEELNKEVFNLIPFV